MKNQANRIRLLRGTAFAALCIGVFGLSGSPAMAKNANGQSSQQNSSSQQSSSGPQNKNETARGQTPPVGANVTVTDEMLHHANQDKNDWLLYGRTYNNQRYSPLTQINTLNVNELRPSAIIQTGIAKSFEDNPIEVNGILYISTPDDHVQAYNAVSGKLLWRYVPNINYSSLCCGPESRGVAVAYGKVFIARLDGRLVALNARTGEEEWKTQVVKSLSKPTKYSFTLAPQVYDGMVIVGSAGAEYQIRGFVAAYDAKTGKQDWMFRTTAAPNQPGGGSWSDNSWKTGGGSVWNTPAVDQKNGLVLFGEGNPNPDNFGKNRKGNNAYTSSIVALDAKTGKLAWWYQQVPHNVWDYDSTGPVVLLPAKDHGKDVAAAAEANKVGRVYIVNRKNGNLIRKSQPFVMQSANMFTKPSSKPITIYPGAQGGGMWSPAAYSPTTHEFYVMGVNEAWVYTAHPPKKQSNKSSGGPTAGQHLGGELKPVVSPHPKNTIAPSGTLSAVNVDTGKIDWQYHSNLPMVGGVVATAGNLIFAGEMNGDFDAFNAHTGQKLWHFDLGIGVNAPPITYRVNGTQYVAVAAGGNAANGNPELMKERGLPQFGDTLAIFALPSKGEH